MASEKVSLKAGMGGSNGGKGRTAGTADYKAAGRKQRRAADKRACQS